MSKLIAGHRKKLATHAADCHGVANLTFRQYCDLIAAELEGQLRPSIVGGAGSSAAVATPVYPIVHELPPIPEALHLPWLLPSHQDQLRPQGATTASWIASLPRLCRDNPLTRGAHLMYSAADVEYLLTTLLGSRASGIIDSLRSGAPWAKAPAGTTFPVTKAAEKEERLVQALEVLHEAGAQPDIVADEMIAVALCTCELPHQPDGELDTLVHGANRSLYAVMNHVCRVSRLRTPVGKPRLWTADERLRLDATLRLDAPIVMRVDTMLSRLPQARRILFRGVRNWIGSGTAFDPGRLVAWHQLRRTGPWPESSEKPCSRSMRIPLRPLIFCRPSDGARSHAAVFCICCFLRDGCGIADAAADA